MIATTTDTTAVSMLIGRMNGNIKLFVLNYMNMMIIIIIIIIIIAVIVDPLA
jgi:hypothetical protein